MNLEQLQATGQARLYPDQDQNHRRHGDVRLGRRGRCDL